MKYFLLILMSLMLCCCSSVGRDLTIKDAKIEITQIFNIKENIKAIKPVEEVKEQQTKEIK